MSLIHRSGRVAPSRLVQPDSCSSRPRPLVLSSHCSSRVDIFTLFFFSFELLGGQPRSGQARTGRPRQSTSDSTQSNDSVSSLSKSNQDACPFSGQRYVRVAPCCLFVHRFLSVAGYCPPIHSSAAVVHRNLAFCRSRTRSHGRSMLATASFNGSERSCR